MKVKLVNTSLAFQTGDPSARANLLDNLTLVAGKYYQTLDGKYADIATVNAYQEQIAVTAGETLYFGNCRKRNTGIREAGWTGDGTKWTLIVNGEDGVLSGAYVVPVSGQLCVSVNTSVSSAIVTRSQATYEEWLAQQ
jgi:hypothetical protein